MTKIVNALRSRRTEVLLVLGAALVVTGAALVAPAAGFVIGGGFSLYAGLALEAEDIDE